MKEIDQIFLDHPDGQMAMAFHLAFCDYCHKIDDLIDEESSADKILEVLHDSILLYTMPFFLKYNSILMPVINSIHHTYADSVIMEKAPELWKREHADCLRNIGIEMLLTIVQLLGGYKARRKVSIAVREDAYNRQHDSNGQPT